MTTVKRTLDDLALVPWPEIKDCAGPASGIPSLLTTLARGDEPAATSALAQLRDRVCRYGFVVDQATAPTVPFLWDLVQLPHLGCRARILRLLDEIAHARQWETTAATYPKLLHYPEDYVGWERAAREAVRAGRAVLDALLADPTTAADPDLARAATDLATTLSD
ncbi:hypothetical protein [Streptomyces galbus]|uniref:hypothetical protein n=1 Tax=Streptomyces galbus TaxID=33898 RepID=UPI0019B5428B|nr:hypothetical protein [Streptomyces galbus]GHD25242.1 hypothetical protein GCM10010335_10220 [Streptomyces galbus]